jgi:lipopolysaccharide transport system permease protein
MVEQKQPVSLNLDQEPEWDDIVTPKRSLFEIDFKELWRYRDLLRMFVRRDFVTYYKQTILGPLWFFIQPLFTIIIYAFIFGRVARIPTDGVPPLLFYLAGTTMWGYFSTNFTKTANVFVENQRVFGKIYFPRLIVPLSVTVSGLIRLGIQFLLFLAFYIYYLAIDAPVAPNATAFLLPLLIILMSGFSMAMGLFVTSLTVKYRDFAMALQFVVQLMMYATPIIYPLSQVPEKYRALILANPMASIIETFKYGWLGKGMFSWGYLAYDVVAVAILLLLGILVFNKSEQTFIDSV